MQHIHIDNEHQLIHKITKERVAEMTLKQILTNARSEIENLVDKLELYNVHSMLNHKLVIQKEEDPNYFDYNFIENKLTLSSDLLNLIHFPHKKRKQYCLSQIIELKDLIIKYPNDLLEIRKALKVPWFSFQRLLKE